MALNRLAIQHFRNLSNVAIDLQPGVNGFFGINGSGKTSVLEAVHMLGTGRSFRGRHTGALVQHEQQGLLVFGVAGASPGVRLGVEKQIAGDSRIRINGAPAASSSQLAACLPLQLFNSDTFAILNGGPAERRKQLDWVVFHVEHSYGQRWAEYQGTIKQRNALLRRGKINGPELDAWDTQVAQLGETLDQMRRQVFTRLETRFRARLAELADPLFGQTSVGYRRGWRKELSLAEALIASRDGDLQQGVSRVGPHRADLRFEVLGELAERVLSRGQQKMITCAFRVAMADLVAESGRKPLFLIDDLPAELDPGNQSVLARWASESAEQVLVTGIEKTVVGAPWRELGGQWGDIRMFHVEHGGIAPTE
ncbi:DNA replication/repair protein RecF [Biformimicrobium ophioploci]|uniref:DNA replication and repair protein RecF n=1 Tax=Biformimicrobium ophioploci TaxID=3036711 RepID=A0ABQ6LVD3_9GAMM|nr:DNA replication/repair protein RecF [Microbulbifer sp. NKW57]GMG86042.1 DNA replication/repair protein RecF [Microbulbifer sp. NKW57]